MSCPSCPVLGPAEKVSGVSDTRRQGEDVLIILRVEANEVDDMPEASQKTILHDRFQQVHGKMTVLPKPLYN